MFERKLTLKFHVSQGRSRQLGVIEAKLHAGSLVAYLVYTQGSTWSDSIL